jgi:hypothetical protein
MAGILVQLDWGSRIARWLLPDCHGSRGDVPKPRNTRFAARGVLKTSDSRYAKSTNSEYRFIQSAELLGFRDITPQKFAIAPIILLYV